MPDDRMAENRAAWSASKAESGGEYGIRNLAFGGSIEVGQELERRG